MIDDVKKTEQTCNKNNNIYKDQIHYHKSIRCSYVKENNTELNLKSKINPYDKIPIERFSKIDSFSPSPKLNKKLNNRNKINKLKHIKSNVNYLEKINKNHTQLNSSNYLNSTVIDKIISKSNEKKNSKIKINLNDKDIGFSKNCNRDLNANLNQSIIKSLN